MITNTKMVDFVAKGSGQAYPDAQQKTTLANTGLEPCDFENYRLEKHRINGLWK